jgi:hypothetical protein
MSAPNAMLPEHVPSFAKGWYREFVDPNLDIRDGFLHAPQRPGIGTRLKPEVRDRPDAVVVVSDEPGESGIDHWGRAPVRDDAMQAEVERLRRERGPWRET